MTTSTSPTSSSSPLPARLAAVRAGIADAARAAGRSPEELTTIVVTKFHPASLVRELAALGVRDVGENRHQEAQAKAAELAVASPLLEASIDGAHGVLLSIQGGSNLGIFEINDAARLVQEAVHPEANIIFGAVIDDTLGDEVRVTVIAAGFDGGEPNAAKQALESRRSTFVEAGDADAGAGLAATAALDAEDIPEPSTDAWASAESPVTDAAPKDPAFDDENDDLDIPDFLK